MDVLGIRLSTKPDAGWAPPPTGCPIIVAAFTTEVVNHEYLYIQCYSFVVFMTRLSQVQNICEYIIIMIKLKILT